MIKQNLIKEYSKKRKENKEIEDNILERGFAMMSESERYLNNVNRMKKIENTLKR